MGISESVDSDVPNVMKDVPNFLNDVPRVKKCIPKWGSATNNIVMGH